MTIVLLVSFIQVDAQEAALKTRQESIEYRVESGINDDVFNLLDKDIINEVKDWNEDLTMRKVWQRDFWIGIFIPNIYDNLDFID